MNFSDSEKPIVLRFVAFMQQEQERRERESSGFACSGPGGVMLYVNGIPRERKYCPSCKPLRRKPHRCKLAPGGVDVDRYWRVRAQMIARGKEIIRMKQLGKVVEILTKNADLHPYRGGATPLSNYRASYGDLRIEYYHRAKDGMTVLAIKSSGIAVNSLRENEIRSAFNVPADAIPDKKLWEDNTFVDTFEWKPVKQAAMVLA